MTNRTLLIVDDDPGLVRSLKWAFDGCRVVTATDRQTAMRALREHDPGVVSLDLGLPPVPDDPSEGLKVLEDILGLSPHAKVIVVTGQDDRRNAVHAIGLGAYDFYQKPIDAEILGMIVERAFNVHELELENQRLQQKESHPLDGLLTASDKMEELCRTIEKVAPTDVSVLVIGESGTGKELLARALHRRGSRSQQSFVAINCAAIPDNLLESELFGHEKGAFTGALRQVKGKIELAHRGTLFLDEIGDMPLVLQSKMLRFLQERVVERLGGREAIPIDTRLVCATHHDLEALAAKGQFREDLYYRIAEIVLTVPPLRERGDDAVLLARHFAGRYAQQQGKRRLPMAPEALSALRRHPWPGNVRELENRVKRAVTLSDGPSITAGDLDLVGDQDAAAGAPHRTSSLREARERMERQLLLDALAEADGNLTAVSKILGVSRPTVYSLLRQYAIRWSG